MLNLVRVVIQVNAMQITQRPFAVNAMQITD